MLILHSSCVPRDKREYFLVNYPFKTTIYKCKTLNICINITTLLRSLSVTLSLCNREILHFPTQPKLGPLNQIGQLLIKAVLSMLKTSKHSNIGQTRIEDIWTEPRIGTKRIFCVELTINSNFAFDRADVPASGYLPESQSVFHPPWLTLAPLRSEVKKL